MKSKTFRSSGYGRVPLYSVSVKLECLLTAQIRHFFSHEGLVLSMKAKRSLNLEVTLFFFLSGRIHTDFIAYIGLKGSCGRSCLPRSVGPCGTGRLGPETVGYEKHAFSVDLALLSRVQ